MLDSFSSVIIITLGLLNIYQFFISKRDKDSIKSLIRSWQNHAEGIKNALLSISLNPNDYSDKKDMTKSIQVVAQSAVALDKAMTEERFYTDSEVKLKREESERETKNLLNSYAQSKN